MRSLLIDDMRNLGCDRTERTFAGGIVALQSEHWDELYLDHDLGFDENGISKTGYDILCWLEQNKQYLPGEIILVTANPSGRQRMQLLLHKLYEKE